MYAYWITVNYREAYNMHASNGILFNHESPLRGETLLHEKSPAQLPALPWGCRKIISRQSSSQRDWGHAKDYVRAMYLILQQDTPDDYVIVLQRQSLQECRNLCMAFAEIGIEIKFEGEGVNEKDISIR